MFVETVFKSSFCFSYVLFVAAVAVYHVNNVFRVTVYVMSNMSSFAGRMKCVTSKSQTYPEEERSCLSKYWKIYFPYREISLALF